MPNSETNIITDLVLLLVFYLVITPLGYLVRLFGKDPLNRGLESDQDSYWISRE